MFMITRNIIQQQQQRRYLLHLTTKRYMPSHLLQQQNHHPSCIMLRTLSIWTIPKIVLSHTPKSNHKWILGGTLGAVSILSTFVGPIILVAAGGAASIFTWRLFQKTKSWWNYLSPPTTIIESPSMTQALLSQISIHHAAELVRLDAIKELKYFFTTTTQGQQMLEDFGLDHPNDLVWEDVHKSEATRLKEDGQQHRIKVNFWLEDQTSSVPKGGACEVTAVAIVSGQGKIELDQVVLSSPGWHKDEIVPLQL